MLMEDNQLMSDEAINMAIAKYTNVKNAVIRKLFEDMDDEGSNAGEEFEELTEKLLYGEVNAYEMVNELEPNDLDALIHEYEDQFKQNQNYLYLKTNRMIDLVLQDYERLCIIREWMVVNGTTDREDFTQEILNEDIYVRDNMDDDTYKGIVDSLKKILEYSEKDD